MKHYSIDGAATNKSKKLRTILHIANAIVVSAIFMTLLHALSNLFGIDANMPLKTLDKGTVIAAFVAILLGVVILFGLSLLVLSFVFKKLKI